MRGCYNPQEDVCRALDGEIGAWRLQGVVLREEERVIMEKLTAKQ